RAASHDEARPMLDRVDADVAQRLGQHIFGRDDDTLESVILEALRAAGCTLGGAESCTGGLVAARLTEVPGSSDVFMGSAVTYGNQAKMDILDVSGETLAAMGAVSAEVARQMAAGARK